MEVLERAFLYVRRKPGKNLLVFLVVLLLTVFVMTGLFTRRGAQEAAAGLRQSMGGSFSIVPDMQNAENIRVEEKGGQTSAAYVGPPLNEELADTVRRLTGIDSWNAISKTEALLQNEESGALTLVHRSAAYLDDPVASGLVSVEADTATLYSPAFQNGRLRMTEGKPISGSDANMAVISEELAAANGLHIGDRIQLVPWRGDAKAPVILEIKGLFAVEGEQINEDAAAPVHLLENRMFTDHAALAALTGGDSYDRVDFFVKDPARIPGILEELRDNEAVIRDSFAVAADMEEYERLVKPLSEVTGLSNTLIQITVAVSIVVLTLIQMMSARDRRHEMGVMLSMGISKGKIILQHFAEAAAAAVTAFCLAYPVSLFLSKAVFKGLSNTLPSGGAAWEAGIMVSLGDFGWTCGCAAMVIALSSAIGNVWIMRLRPGEILSKMN